MRYPISRSGGGVADCRSRRRDVLGQPGGARCEGRYFPRSSASLYARTASCGTRSPDLAVVSQIADRVAVMYSGSLVELGARGDIFRAPAHPYTRGLLHAVPDLPIWRWCRRLPIASP